MLLNNLINAAGFGKGLYDIYNKYQGQKQGWVDPDQEMQQQNPLQQLLGMGGMGNQSTQQDPMYQPSALEADALSPTSSIPSINQNSQPTMQDLQAAAVAAYPDNPIMQQVVLTQAIQESGVPGHMSQLATQNNNLLGIKEGSTAPGSNGMANYATTEYDNGAPGITRANFSSNNNYGDSFLQHRDLMNKLPRYQGVLNSQDVPSAFGALSKAGYATDPNYTKKLMMNYNKYIKPLYYKA